MREATAKEISLSFSLSDIAKSPKMEFSMEICTRQYLAPGGR